MSNIFYVGLNPVTVKIQWEESNCTGGNFSYYLYYVEVERGLSDHIDWKIRGKEAELSINATKHSMIVQDLEVGVLYEGYLLKSYFGIGNGAPSDNFKFRTKPTRK